MQSLIVLALVGLSVCQYSMGSILPPAALSTDDDFGFDSSEEAEIGFAIADEVHGVDQHEVPSSLSHVRSKRSTEKVLSTCSTVSGIATGAFAALALINPFLLVGSGIFGVVNAGCTVANSFS